MTAREKVTLATIALVTLAVGVLRFTLPHHGLQAQDVFKDAAHLWVGGLFGAALASRDGKLWGAAVGLTVLEVVAALVQR